jgi:hypothetical protein
VEGSSLGRSQTQAEEHMTEYAYKTYGMARFYVPEGMYSIKEIEEMLADMKEAKRHQDERLKAAMQPLKEKNHDYQTCNSCGELDQGLRRESGAY